MQLARSPVLDLCSKDIQWSCAECSNRNEAVWVPNNQSPIFDAKYTPSWSARHRSLLNCCRGMLWGRCSKIDLWFITSELLSFAWWTICGMLRVVFQTLHQRILLSSIRHIGLVISSYQSSTFSSPVPTAPNVIFLLVHVACLILFFFDRLSIVIFCVFLTQPYC